MYVKPTTSLIFMVSLLKIKNYNLKVYLCRNKQFPHLRFFYVFGREKTVRQDSHMTERLTGPDQLR